MLSSVVDSFAFAIIEMHTNYLMNTLKLKANPFCHACSYELGWTWGGLGTCDSRLRCGSDVVTMPKGPRVHVHVQGGTKVIGQANQLRLEYEREYIANICFK